MHACGQVRLAGLEAPLSAVADITYLDAPRAAVGPTAPEVAKLFDAPYYEWWNARKVRVGAAMGMPHPVATHAPPIVMNARSILQRSWLMCWPFAPTVKATPPSVCACLLACLLVCAG